MWQIIDFIVIVHLSLCLTWYSLFQYLTTVIPYEKKAGSPVVEDLQILTKSEYIDTLAHQLDHNDEIRCDSLRSLFVLKFF